MMVGTPIANTILTSPLMRQGGFAVFEGLPDAIMVAQLYQEAFQQYPYADIQESRDDDFAEGRGGKPKRSLLTAGAGPVQDAWYTSAWLRDFLSNICGLAIAPSGNRGSYSYYVRPGDFLDLHCDVETCDLAVITVLCDNSDPSDQAGALILYPNRIHEPLSAIRASLHQGAVALMLLPGQTVVMFGGIVPHRVLPVRDGQSRVISALCLQVLTETSIAQGAVS